MSYKIYVSDGNAEMTLFYTSLYRAMAKVEELVQKFPDYMISIRTIKAD